MLTLMTDINPTAPEGEQMTDPADPHYVDPDAELDSEAIADGARKSYSLSDRLKGIKHRHTKLLVFLDGDAVDAYAAANNEVENLGEQVMLASQAIDPAKPDTQTQYERLLKLHDEKEEALEPLRAEMLSSALAIYLKAFPNIAIKVAKREAYLMLVATDQIGTLATDEPGF
jgi:hypothetical protein